MRRRCRTSASTDDGRDTADYNWNTPGETEVFPTTEFVMKGSVPMMSATNRRRRAGVCTAATLLAFTVMVGCEKPGEPQAANPEIPPSERDDAQPSNSGPVAGSGGNSSLGRAKNSAENLVNRAEERSKEIAEKYGNN